MAKQSVKQVLGLMEPEQEVILDVYGYGIRAAYSLDEGFRTAKDCLDHVRRDIQLAKVQCIKTHTWQDKISGKDITSLLLVVELAQ